MERYAKLTAVYWRYHFKYHVLAALLLFCLMPFLMGTQYLNPEETAKILEYYAALSGILLLVPIFLPDDDKDIRELLASRRMPMAVNYLSRFSVELFCLFLFVGGAVLFLKCNGCNFPAGAYFLGTFAEALFLGGIGLLAYSLSGNGVVGYMIPMVCYVLNFGGRKYVGNFYLFSMTAGKYGPKYWLAAAGMLAVSLGIGWRGRRL